MRAECPPQKLCHEIQDLKSALARKTQECDNGAKLRQGLESQSRDEAAATRHKQQSKVCCLRPGASPGRC